MTISVVYCVNCTDLQNIACFMLEKFPAGLTTKWGQQTLGVFYISSINFGNFRYFCVCMSTAQMYIKSNFLRLHKEQYAQCHTYIVTLYGGTVTQREMEIYLYSKG